MNFLKSVFSEDAEPSESENLDPNPNSSSLWGSVIESYKKDFEDFRSGLKKETAVIREAASRAVKGLPAKFEIGASVAQESLESVGQAIDDIGSTVWKSTAEIISQGKRNLLTESSYQNDSVSDSNINYSSRRLSDVKTYSRFEMQLKSIQSDSNTYCKEPDDMEEYENWKIGFKLDDERMVDIENLIRENGVIGEIYKVVVLNNEIVDEETFWSRYFYRVHKLKQAEEARARLVKTATSMVEDEDLSWDFDDEEEESAGTLVKGESGGNLEQEEGDSGEKLVNENVVEQSKDGNSGSEENDSDKSVVVNAKAESGDSCKDSDVSVVSSQPSLPEVEDLGWDEIEDIGSNDENKGDAVGSVSRGDLRKRLSAAEDEDLSWDIEDDDEPGKP